MNIVIKIQDNVVTKVEYAPSFDEGVEQLIQMAQHQGFNLEPEELEEIRSTGEYEHEDTLGHKYSFIVEFVAIPESELV